MFQPRKSWNLLLIGLMTAGMLALTAVLLAAELSEAQTDLFALRIASDGKEETVSIWKDEEETYYAFLPGYADLSRMSVHLYTASPVSVGGVLLTEGMPCGAFQTDTLYDVTYSVFGKRHHSQMMFVQASGIPALYVDTVSGNMESIHRKKEHQESALIRLYSSAGRQDYAGEASSFHGRGNGTWNAPTDKKPYGFTLNQEADLLGMGAAQNWVLLANYYDASHLRNKLLLDFASDAGLAYTPDSEWVNLYLNGMYAGLYLLCEKVEVHSQRVDIAARDGFLVSMDFEDRMIEQRIPYVKTQHQQALRIHAPVQPDEADRQRIASVFQSIENALLSPDGRDPITGKHWLELIDLDSWTRKYLVEEIAANLDACFLSQYFYTAQADGKVYAGPIWDMDMALGGTWEVSDPGTLYANRYYARGEKNTPWFHALYQQEAFYRRVTELFSQEMLPLLHRLNNEVLPTYLQQIDQSAAMNEMRRSETRTQEETAELHDFLTKRIAFLSKIWLEGQEYVSVVLDPGTGGYYGYRMTRTGTPLQMLPTLPDNKNQRFLGWYRADNHEPFDAAEPVSDDLRLYAKWQDTGFRRLGQLIQLLPLGMIGLMGAGLLLADFRRNPGEGRRKR